MIQSILLGVFILSVAAGGFLISPSVGLILLGVACLISAVLLAASE